MRGSWCRLARQGRSPLTAAYQRLTRCRLGTVRAPLAQRPRSPVPRQALLPAPLMAADAICPCATIVTRASCAAVAPRRTAPRARCPAWLAAVSASACPSRPVAAPDRKSVPCTSSTPVSCLRGTARRTCADLTDAPLRLPVAAARAPRLPSQPHWFSRTVSSVLYQAVAPTWSPRSRCAGALRFACARDRPLARGC